MYEVDYEAEIVKHLPFVRRVVNRIDIKSAEYDKDDLFNIGVIGLMDALKKFDVNKKVSFESYAYIRIRGAVIDEIRKTSRVSRSRMGHLDSFYKAKEKIEREKMTTATDKEICEELNINTKQLSKIHETIHYLANISLDDTIFTIQGETLELKDMIEDTDSIPIDKMMIDDEKKQALRKAVALLKEREQIILNLYYTEELTLKEIAEILEISVPRVSQLHGKTLIKLKKIVEDELI
ncbi:MULTISPECIES: FliA/WhiG family RNA polymerase sigma factor [Vagococcus]|uniref:RNA polymerase sigma factor for flagellar operon n=1 Tax=Vagococcus fluvialis bH819 TaxID=1255619 RepID=A0A1X6WRH0_9ENTE|nr:MULTISPECIES: FliA/WhiG family RNA polymerase sigma factor [Vagococcus]SLM86894.1 RNA polymerase sigma factor for flagellar operon [Vagococcus fluvialis bH819]HCM88649.1 FliA/WhiG family RNA polymerase sigma factor [Vagococcus sp.]